MFSSVNQLVAHAVFGYTSSESFDRAFALGTQSMMSPSPVERGQLTLIKHGTIKGAFVASFIAAEGVTWTLGSRSAHASADTARCVDLDCADVPITTLRDELDAIAGELAALVRRSAALLQKSMGPWRRRSK